MIPHADDIAGGAAGLVAVLGALGYIARKMRAALRRLDAIERVVTLLPALERLVQAELTHNGGGSIKDDVHGIAVSQHALASRLDGLETAITEDKQ